MMTGQSAPVIAILASDNDAGEAFANKVIAFPKKFRGKSIQYVLFSGFREKSR
jgi:hypothetical protein